MKLFKKAVAIDIPLDNNFGNQNISLAEAFKKKLGGLPSEKNRN